MLIFLFGRCVCVSGLYVLCALGFRMGAANLRCGSARWLHHPKPDVDCSMQEEVATPLWCLCSAGQTVYPHTVAPLRVFFFCENCLSLSLNKIVPFFALCTERCRHMCRHRRSSSLVGIILSRRWRETWKTQDYHQSPGVCSQSRIHFCWDSAVRSDFCSCCPAQARRRQGQRTVF